MAGGGRRARGGGLGSRRWQRRRGPRCPTRPPRRRPVAGDAQITVSFDPPNSDSPIVGYHATCTDGTFSTSRSGASSPIIVFGPHIVNGTSYTCTVDATSASGTSAESGSSAAVVPAAVPRRAARSLGGRSRHVHRRHVRCAHEQRRQPDHELHRHVHVGRLRRVGLHDRHGLTAQRLHRSPTARPTRAPRPRRTASAPGRHRLGRRPSCRSGNRTAPRRRRSHRAPT